jgi:hypothetical protein
MAESMPSPSSSAANEIAVHNKKVHKRRSIVFFIGLMNFRKELLLGFYGKSMD